MDFRIIWHSCSPWSRSAISNICSCTFTNPPPSIRTPPPPFYSRFVLFAICQKIHLPRSPQPPSLTFAQKKSDLNSLPANFSKKIKCTYPPPPPPHHPTPPTPPIFFFRSGSVPDKFTYTLPPLPLHPPSKKIFFQIWVLCWRKIHLPPPPFQPPSPSTPFPSPPPPKKSDI